MPSGVVLQKKVGGGLYCKIRLLLYIIDTYCLLLLIAVLFPTRLMAEMLHPAANSWEAGEILHVLSHFLWDFFAYLNTV